MLGITLRHFFLPIYKTLIINVFFPFPSIYANVSRSDRKKLMKKEEKHPEKLRNKGWEFLQNQEQKKQIKEVAKISSIIL